MLLHITRIPALASMTFQEVLGLRSNDQFSKTYRLTACRHARTLRSSKCRSFVIGHLLVTTLAVRKFCHVEGDPRFSEDDVP